MRSGESLKMLGFIFSSRPTVKAHVQALIKRLRSRLWIIRHLKEACFTQEELVKVYKSIIRPVHDYLCVVYHAMMTDEQDEQVERIQSQALKAIYGWKLPYAELRARAGVSTLRQRRVELTDKFAASSMKNPRFSHWFPLVEGVRRSRRGCLLYTSPSPRD